MRWRQWILVVVFWLLGSPMQAAEVLLIDDALNGATLGTQEGGTFTGGGWQAEAGNVRITYDLGQTYAQGRFEVDLTNFEPCSQPNNEKCHILSMWQSSNQYRDSSAAADESHWIVRTGTGYFPPASTDCHYKLLTRSQGPEDLTSGYEERIDHDFVDASGTTYHYELSWEPTGRVVLKRDGNVLYDHSHGAPVLLRYLLVGRDREPKPNYGEQPGVLYKNVKVTVEDQSGSGGDGGVGPADAATSDAGGGLQQILLPPIDDTFADPLNPDQVHGSEPTVQVGGDGSDGIGRTIYFKFDLTGVTGVVQQARLHLRATNAGWGGAVVSVPDSTWSESTLTWNNRPMMGAALYDQAGAVVIDDSYALDVTAAMWLGASVSMAMISTANDGAAYGSKENPDLSTRPVLELVILPGSRPDAGPPQDVCTCADAWAPEPDAAGLDTAHPDTAALVDHAVADSSAADTRPPDGAQADARLQDSASQADASTSCQRNGECPQGEICVSFQCQPEAVADPGCGCAMRRDSAVTLLGPGLLLLGLGLCRRRV
ncbi:MAG: DNRLRE domain-containing protein [Pseudomonadota bacterium]